MLKELIYPSTLAAVTIWGNSVIVGRRLEDTTREIDSRLDHTDRRLDRVDQRLDRVDQRLDHMDRKLDNMDRGLDHMKKELDGLLDNMNSKSLIWQWPKIGSLIARNAGDDDLSILHRGQENKHSRHPVLRTSGPEPWSGPN